MVGRVFTKQGIKLNIRCVWCGKTSMEHPSSSMMRSYGLQIVKEKYLGREKWMIYMLNNTAGSFFWSSVKRSFLVLLTIGWWGGPLCSRCWASRIWDHVWRDAWKIMWYFNLINCSPPPYRNWTTISMELINSRLRLSFSFTVI